MKNFTLKDKKYILFDLDGTLIDPKQGITKAVQYALRSFDVHVEDLDTLMPFIGPPLQRSFEELYGFDSEKAFAAVWKYREYFGETGIYENELYPGIAALLRDLQRSGYCVILATSKPTAYAERILEYWGIDRYVSFVAGSEFSGERVEKYEVITFAMEHCGITSPQEAVMIGDRKHDVIGARNLGMPCVAVQYGYGSSEELAEAEADCIVDTVAELRQLWGEITPPSFSPEPLGLVAAELIAREEQRINRIVHSLKMHGYAMAIAAGEGIQGEELHLVQAAALLHDIGISEAVRLFGKSTAALQEQLGARLAQRILRRLGWSEENIERICFLIGNHHSYHVDGGPLLQIIFEADFCVNFQESSAAFKDVSAEEMLQSRLKTVSGKRIFASMHLAETDTTA